MTINHLSGNFQPLTQVSGGTLPQIKSSSEATYSSPEFKPTISPTAEVDIRELLSSLQTNVDKLAENEGQNQISQNIQRRLSFQVDDDSGKTVVKVFDRETEELIRQFPPEELLALSKRLRELNDQAAGSTNLGILIKSEV